MGVDEFRSVGRRTIASASFLDLERIHLTTPQGAGVVRVVVRHPGAVAVVAIVEDELLLIRQYRSAVDRALLEIPAGKLDVPGEPPEVTAHRELQEEMGYRAGSLEPLATFFTAPGFSDEVMHVFVATALEEAAAEPHGAEEEVAETVRVPLAGVPPLLLSGEIEDAKTLAALGLFLARQR